MMHGIKSFYKVTTEIILWMHVCEAFLSVAYLSAWNNGYISDSNTDTPTWDLWFKQLIFFLNSQLIVHPNTYSLATVIWPCVFEGTVAGIALFEFSKEKPTVILSYVIVSAFTVIHHIMFAVSRLNNEFIMSNLVYCVLKLYCIFIVHSYYRNLREEDEEETVFDKLIYPSLPGQYEAGRNHYEPPPRYTAKCGQPNSDQPEYPQKPGAMYPYIKDV